ncbi:MAG: NADH-quinone oxidoreductase subunit N [Bacteroidota bacterium]
MNLIIIAAVWGIVMMLSGLFLKGNHQPVRLAFVGALLLIAGNIADLYGYAITHNDFNHLLEYDKFGSLFLLIISIALLFFVWVSGKEVVKVGSHPYEYFALIFFVVAGAGLVTLYNNLLIMFLGIEILSSPLFILTGSDKRNLKSNEAALKYFLMGAFSTGILLLGIAFIYGATGSFQVANYVMEDNTMALYRLLGLALILIAMSFKVSAAPFHFWTPDVYDGAPTPFTSFMSSIVKMAAFVGYAQLMMNGFSNEQGKWKLVLAILIALTLFIGNITAVYQQSVKRMLAYSSIAQAGFMLMAVYSINDLARMGLLLYTVAYCLGTIGIFAVLAKMKDYTYEGFNGLASKNPLLAFCLTVFLMSLAGIPLTGGFFAKYYMLSAVVKSGGYLWLVVTAVVLAAVSIFYYFKVIQAMYFKSAAEHSGLEAPVSLNFKLGLLVAAIFVILLGIFPYQLLLNALTVY